MCVVKWILNLQTWDFHFVWFCLNLSFSLFILTVAAAEAAIGLAILVVYFRNKGTIDVKDINVLKG